MATLQAAKMSPAAVAVMREWGPSEFRANHARIVDEAAALRASWSLFAAHNYLAEARAVREFAAMLAPSRLP